MDEVGLSTQNVISIFFKSPYQNILIKLITLYFRKKLPQKPLFLMSDCFLYAICQNEFSGETHEYFQVQS